MRLTWLRRALALAVTLALAAGAAFGGERPARLLGKVKAVDADGSALDLVAKGATYRVPLAGAAVEVHRAVTFKDLAASGGAGATMYVLGRHQPPARDPNSGSTLPAQIVQVVAVVVSESFKPPEVPPDLAERKLEWISGRAEIGANDVRLNDVNVQVGLERKAVVIAAATKDDIGKAKGKTGFVEGERDRKTIKAARFALIAPGLSAAEYRAILGL